MGQNRKRTRKSSGQRMKPTRGNRATSTNAKEPHAKNCSAKKSPANKAPLAAHLQKFAEAVADDHSDVEAAILDEAARIEESDRLRVNQSIKEKLACR
jgi:hypothetical protein